MPNPSKLSQIHQIATELYDADQILEQIRHQKQTEAGLTAGELETIASALKEHPAVDDAVVAVRADAAGVEHTVAYVVADERRSPVMAGLPRYTLLNSMAVVYHRNRYDIELLSREIFEDRLYFKHGIVVQEGDCIFDVGASIGLFTLLVQQLCPSTQVYAFEPAPSIFEILRLNTSLYGANNARLFNHGLGSTTEAAIFTFYPENPLLSGYHADDTQYLASPWLNGAPAITKINSHVRPLSDVLREHNIERVDLLKIDAEGSEVEILKGIRPADYARIGQIVMEVHSEPLLEQVVALLEQHGYTLTVEERKDLKETDQVWPAEYMLYALRDAGLRRSSGPQQGSLVERPLPIILGEPLLSKDELYGFLQEILPAQMMPAAFMFMNTLPRDHQGAIALQDLPIPGKTDLISSGESDHGFVAPRTPMEKELADIWSEFLDIERIGIYDDFFQLGGDSILAANIIARAQEMLHIQVPIDVLFEDTFTIARLARALEQYQIEQANPQEIADMLAELNGLSDDEVRALLAEE